MKSWVRQWLVLEPKYIYKVLHFVRICTESENKVLLLDMLLNLLVGLLAVVDRVSVLWFCKPVINCFFLFFYIWTCVCVVLSTEIVCSDTKVCLTAYCWSYFCIAGLQWNKRAVFIADLHTSVTTGDCNKIVERVSQNSCVLISML